MAVTDGVAGVAEVAEVAEVGRLAGDVAEVGTVDGVVVAAKVDSMPAVDTGVRLGTGAVLAPDVAAN